MKCQDFFSIKKKIIINVLSAAVLNDVLRVRMILRVV